MSDGLPAHPDCGPPGPFRVLFVCTGNRVRSPLAAALLDAELTRALPCAATVTSAGTLAPEGRLAHRLTVDALAARGIDIAGFTSRRLDAGLAMAADLVLGFERSHVDQVLALWPSGLRTTFTLPVFARLAPSIMVPKGPQAAPTAQPHHAGRSQHTGVEVWQGAVAQAARLRQTISAPDIADPLCRDHCHQQSIMAETIRAVHRVATALIGMYMVSDGPAQDRP